MTRRWRLLLSISTTVAVTLFVAWVAVQALVLRPAVAEREPLRIQQVREAAALLADGVGKREIEVSRGIDIRLLAGEEAGPPPGGGWTRLDTDQGTVWKRDDGNYELAVWTGQTWVVLQDHPPHGATLALGLGAAAVPLVLLMFGLSQRANRHQDVAEKSLARIAEGDLSVRLDTEAGHREVRRVAVAVNSMADRLQALVEADRQRMAGLSHELRTPLTRVRLELEIARREGVSAARLDRVERDIEDFDAMLREMLELSRLETVGEQLMVREEVDLAGLAQLVVDEEDWSDVQIRGAGVARVDSKLMARVLRNLLRNCLQHAGPSRRWVEVTDDGFTVGDDGAGIPLDRQERLTEAFQRGASSLGHGLGLAIVAQIVRLHGGTVDFSAPPGLLVRVRLPTST